MKIAIINGPNLNLLGKRETDIYGNMSFEKYLDELKALFPAVEFHYYQTNVEGELVNELQRLGYEYDGIVLNPAGYTHTSVAIGDAIAAVGGRGRQRRTQDIVQGGLFGAGRGRHGGSSRRVTA